jgi:hypothetical protein
MSLLLLAKKVVVIWISFPTEHRKCLPHRRFQLSLLLTTVWKYVFDTQEFIILQWILIVRVVSLWISSVMTETETNINRGRAWPELTVLYCCYAELTWRANTPDHKAKDSKWRSQPSGPPRSSRGENRRLRSLVQRGVAWPELRGRARAGGLVILRQRTTARHQGLNSYAVAMNPRRRHQLPRNSQSSRDDEAGRTQLAPKQIRSQAGEGAEAAPGGPRLAVAGVAPRAGRGAVGSGWTRVREIGEKKIECFFTIRWHSRVIKVELHD